MGTNAYGYDDNADLWGLNPDTGRLYTVAERRNMLARRGMDSSALGGGQSTPMWDNWFDKVAESNYERTGKTPAQLTVGFTGGPSPEGSNQLTGQSLQPAVHGLKAAVASPKVKKPVVAPTEANGMSQDALEALYQVLQRGK